MKPKSVWVITLINNKKLEAENVRLEDGFVALYRETTEQVMQDKKIKKFFRTIVKKIPTMQTLRVFTHIIPPQQIKIIELKEGK